MADSGETPEAIGADYAQLRPTYEAFAEKLRLLMCDLLGQAGIAVVQTESRGKTVESVVGKVRDKQEKYAEPLKEMTDLSGVRIIAYYLEDVEKIGELIHSEFDVDEERSVQKGGDFDPDRFGYVSDHLIVKLSSPRRELGEWSSFSDLVAEIQVRTATQHAWAAIEHRLGYKSAKQLPSAVRRRLYRLSALFELADDQFSGVRSAVQDIEREYSDTLRRGNLSVPLDVASLEAYVGESPTVQGVLDSWRKAGGVVHGPKGTNPRREMDKSDLLKALSARNIADVAELDQHLARMDEVEPLLPVFLGQDLPPDERGELDGWPEDVLNQCLFLLWRAPKDEVVKIYTPPTYEAYERAYSAHPA